MISHVEINYWYLALAAFLGATAAIVALGSVYNALAPRIPYPLGKMLLHAAIIAATATGAVYFYNLA